jgi:BCD family chlorophyll transporter-like MFS transporter
MTASQNMPLIGWLGIVRLGLIQSSLGAIVILMTSTLNRVMVVELGLAAAIPGMLVGLHYAVQLSRPRWGFGADAGGRQTPWILGGMAVLASGAVLASLSAAMMQANLVAGLGLSFIAFVLIGGGVGAAGTNLLALLAIRTPPERKAAAAAIVWIMMIVGFILTAGIGGQLLKPFSFERLILVTAGTGLISVTLTGLALLGLEKRGDVQAPSPPASDPRPDFKTAVAEIWAETEARRFTIFVFVSMLAYSAQDLILEPFAGIVHGFGAGASTQLAGIQNVGTLIGMITVALAGTLVGKSRAGFMRAWTIGGCLASAASLLALAAGTQALGASWPLVPNILALGVSNGVFAVSAIGSMMTLASRGRASREGTRMGLWGASQAIAFGIGGLAGAVSLDLARLVFADPSASFSTVFAVEGVLFVAAAWLATRISRPEGETTPRLPILPAGEFLLAEGRKP